MTNQVGWQRLTETVICDRLVALAARNIESFHALPLARMSSISSSKLVSKYEAIFGRQLLEHDLSYTGTHFDTPVMPRRCVEESRRTTAEAFGATYSCYVTTGTTTSNYIAVFALAEEGARVLADRTCHQSIHLALLKTRSQVRYGRIKRRDDLAGRTGLDVAAFIEEYRAASNRDEPYQLVILNGCSYEGVLYDVERIITECVLIRDDVTFLVDEAWFAFAYFHSLYRRYTAMNAANVLARAHHGKRFSVVSTQSAHKSLSSMRQGSYIHIYGSEDVVNRIKETQYKIHTTSPSYPILASLELARAQAVSECRERIDNALRLANRIRESLSKMPALGAYVINESAELVDEYTAVDPLRLSINAARTRGVKALKEFLFERYGLYVNRVTATSFLVNVHIGVSEAGVERLLRAMEEFASLSLQEAELENLVSDRYIIPYPPGVPLVVPGDSLTRELRDALANLSSAGVDIFHISR